jgi:hypothetical protein
MVHAVQYNSIIKCDVNYWIPHPTALITNPRYIFDTGYSFGYAMGFGGPYLLPTYLPTLNFGKFLNYLSPFFPP